jgi:hypothetical protein
MKTNVQFQCDHEQEITNTALQRGKRKRKNQCPKRLHIHYSIKEASKAMQVLIMINKQ